MVGPIEVQLPRDTSASSRARRLLEASMAGNIDGGQLERSKLLVSELVNNAVLHGQGKITLRVDLDEDRLHVEVIDEGSGFERVVRENDFDQVGGWGLTLVEAESSRWGVHEGTTRVWFEIEQTGLASATTRIRAQPIPTDRRQHRPRPIAVSRHRRGWHAGSTILMSRS